MHPESIARHGRSHVDRRRVLAAIGAAPFAARAQGLARVYRVGLVSIAGAEATWQPLIDGLRAMGYSEGRNLQLHPTFAQGNAERIGSMVEQLVRDGVDVIVTSGNRETRAAAAATSTIPVVMLFVPDPVSQGFARSLGQPGGNVTGLTNMVPGLSQKYVELMRELLPDAQQLAVLASPSNPVAEHRAELDMAAQRARLALRYLPVASQGDIEPALARARRAGVQGLIVTQDPLTFLHRRTLVQAAEAHRLPAIYWAREYVDAGGFMTYSARIADLVRRGAVFVDKLLRGARAAELPIEQPTTFELVVNLKAAQLIGAAVPPSFLLRADEVLR
jgi:putative ABC transport system substrate-binding protein